jgi:hypothetical protein
MKSRFIVVDQACAQELIQDRNLQSTEFESGCQLALWLLHRTPNDVTTNRFALIREGGGLFFLLPKHGSKNSIIIDYERAPLFDEMTEADALLVFQRLLRFVVKYWTKGRLSSSYERLIPDSTKAVVFPFPYSQQTAFRVVIERQPDRKRLEKRAELGNFLLVYKCGKHEGEGPREVAEVTNFRKAIEALPAARTRADAMSGAGQAQAEFPAAALGVTTLDRLSTQPLSPFMGFDQWSYYLTEKQKEFMQQPLQKPHRIEGPAGTGKTLALTLKCIATLRRALHEGAAHKSLLIAHSEPTRDHIEALFRTAEPDASRLLDVGGNVNLRIRTLQVFVRKSCNAMSLRLSCWIAMRWRQNS